MNMTVMEKLRAAWSRLTVDHLLYGLVGAAGVGAVALFLYFLIGNSRIEVMNEYGGQAVSGPASPITGKPCADPSARPLAVMLASDAEARPLSGIAAAELVIELPVTPNGITRMMGVFQCELPDEIGSIRSARDNFIGLAKAFGAIYAHWGGERDALDRLDAGYLDNIDALAYEGTVFFRKTEIPRPHNGFTTPDHLYDKAVELDYAVTASLSPFWPHRTARPPRTLGGAVEGFGISYTNGGRVHWAYDGERNDWVRSRNGTPELDAIDGRQVRASAVIVMEADSEFLYDQYIAVTLTGSGDAALFQDGTRRSVRWSRADDDAMPVFTHEDGSPVALAPGTVWISVITPGIGITP
ncbi:MAG TPA: DUF3048 domain-containing protein [Candidatus Paceibacterota bacterium]|nr:DUF3048 domain-containing protein [Candidatus Paceibacterota bacterium]